MANIIEHRGIVESVNGSHLRVKIVQTSACSSCAARGHCSASESKEKIIDVETSGVHFSVGDPVEIYGETSIGMMAVLYAFIVPFFIMVVVLFLMMHFTQNNELLSVAVSIAFLACYYIVLSLNKHKLKKNFSFKVKSINN